MKFPTYRRRLVIASAFVAVASLALAGCSATSSSSAPSSSAAGDSNVKGDITFSTWWAYANQDLISGFTKTHPNVNVRLDFTAIDSYPTKLQSEASSGSLPDVFAVQGAPLTALAKAKQLYNLNDALASKPYDGTAKSWKASFVPNLLAGANTGLEEPNGETYGVPFNAISVASVYNKDVFSKVGIKPPTTFDQLISNCKKLSNAGYIPMSLTGSVWATWWPNLAWDQTMRDDKVADFSVSNPDYVKGFKIVKEMADAKCWAPSQVTSDIAGETALFLQKKTAQFVTVPENFLQSVATGANFKIGSYVLPALDGKQPVHTLGGGGANVLAINANSKNLATAVAFAKYLTSTQVETSLAKTQYTLPSINIPVSSDNPLMQAYIDAAKGGFTNPTVYMPALSVPGKTTFVNKVLPDLILGKTTPEQAAAATQGLFISK